MSNLKHLTTAELREVIQREDRRCANLLGEAARNDEEATNLEAFAQGLRQQAAKKRMQEHGYRQRIVWARKYLAEKEIANARP